MEGDVVGVERDWRGRGMDKRWKKKTYMYCRWVEGKVWEGEEEGEVGVWRRRWGGMEERWKQRGGGREGGEVGGRRRWLGEGGRRGGSEEEVGVRRRRWGEG